MGNPKLPQNSNIPLPPSITLDTAVVAAWPITSGSTYEVTMNINDPLDQEGNKSDLTEKLGLFYCTDTPYTVGNANAWQSYSDYYNNYQPVETIRSYPMYGSNLHGFAFLPLDDTTVPGQIIIGPKFATKKSDGSFWDAGTISYIPGKISNAVPVPDSAILSDGIVIYTKCIDEHKSFKSDITYIHKFVGPITLRISLKDYVYCHVLIGNKMYVFTKENTIDKDTNQSKNFFFDIGAKDSLLVFAALFATSDGKFEIGDPRVDAAMSCTRVTRTY